MNFRSYKFLAVTELFDLANNDIKLMVEFLFLLRNIPPLFIFKLSRTSVNIHLIVLFINFIVSGKGNDINLISIYIVANIALIII